ncbi:alpha/beta hydrolase [Methyloprofundus sp.]|uniref:alpha/beta hydrolase n=1 Tax=Methyloprofundus sp. TaxID=2020875 RepID=UPI003D114514
MKPTLIPQRLVLVLLLANILGCTPKFYPAGSAVTAAQLVDNLYITRDGALLPLKIWQPPAQDEINAVIIALHGFNEYSHFFAQAGNYFSLNNTISYAYDQRGFGGSSHRGLWAGTKTYSADLNNFIELIKLKHGGVPVYVLGVSMGGAIVITAMVEANHQAVDGIILCAPAVWARQTMPWYQNMLLSTVSHTTPWMTLTGESVGIMPSDNIEVLKELSRDPLVIKETRVETIYGLVNLMDQAYNSAESLSVNTILLYGEKDEVIPKQATYQFLNNLNKATPNQYTIAIYEQGYHLLLRDLQAATVWQDIVSWMHSYSSPLNSGADTKAKQIFEHAKE